MVKEVELSKGVRKQRRGAVNGYRGRLNIRGTLDPAFEYRIVNDIDDGSRIGWFQENDWEIVSKNDLQVGDKRVDKTSPEGTPVKISVGLGTKAYLMRKPKEWFDEDQADKQAKIDAQEGRMRPDDTYGKLEIVNEARSK